MPPGVPYIIGNEAAERFSYYGMNSILVVFMTSYLLGRDGAPDHMTETQADAWYHTFVFGLYFLPVLGAILGDAILGKYRTVLSLSIVYCFGHLALALDHTRAGLAVGMALIALGAGGIKPCVSANVGDQFGPANQHLLPRVFSWFYFSVNFGSFFATLLIPWLLQHRSPQIAFGTPGILMLIATIVFWLGRNRFVHRPPAGMAYVREVFSAAGLKALGNLLSLAPFVAVFWALWQQNYSSWVNQAKLMDRHCLGVEWLPAQVQSVNPIMVLVCIPLFTYVVYPAVERHWRLTPLRKIGSGLFVGVAAFAVVAWVQTRIDAGARPNIGWQLLAYAFLTVAEVLVSMTFLEFSYTQAPRKLKSLVMAIYFGAISLGNLITAAVNFLILNPDGSSKLTGVRYFGFFTMLMLVAAVLYVLVAQRYQGRTWLDEE
jgi:POT family proton-dependent oligopeptide transporter